ncbi:MAG: sugar porter family MFS transporter [Acidobacteriota bacterium]|nr:sugar porter family MFS transporter [Acidobacteriota bacterium]
MAADSTSAVSPAEQAGSSTYVYLAAFFAALGGLLFGYDTGVISGALLFIRQQFGLSTFRQELVVSVVLVGAAIAALGGGRLADRFGRRATLLLTAAIFVVGAVLCAAAPTAGLLVAGRVIVGLGIGLSSTTVPLYISEISPAKARGWQVSLFQLAITVGILAAYIVDYAFSGSQSWRWMLGLAVVPGLVLGIGMFFMPETPRWLARRGRPEQARRVLEKVRGSADVTEELQEIEATLAASQERGRWADLWSPTVRPALLIGTGLAMFQQITGINTVIYYAPTIIRSTGIPSASGAILATAGIGLVNVLMTVVSMWLIDRIGRRPLLLAGTGGMVITMGALGLLFRTHVNGGSLATLEVVLLMSYVASFAVGLGPIFWLLISEIYPLKIRGEAEGTAAATNWVFNFLVSLTFLTLVQVMGASDSFWLYGLLSVAGWIFCYALVPETKGRTLEEIEATWHKTHPRTAS